MLPHTGYHDFLLSVKLISERVLNELHFYLICFSDEFFLLMVFKITITVAIVLMKIPENTKKYRPQRPQKMNVPLI